MDQHVLPTGQSWRYIDLQCNGIIEISANSVPFNKTGSRFDLFAGFNQQNNRPSVLGWRRWTELLGASETKRRQQESLPVGLSYRVSVALQLLSLKSSSLKLKTPGLGASGECWGRGRVSRGGLKRLSCIFPGSPTCNFFLLARFFQAAEIEARVSEFSFGKYKSAPPASAGIRASVAVSWKTAAD